LQHEPQMAKLVTATENR